MAGFRTGSTNQGGLVQAVESIRAGGQEKRGRFPCDGKNTSCFDEADQS